MATCYSLPSASWARLFGKLSGLTQSCQRWLVACGEQDLLLPGELPAAIPHAMGDQ